MSHGRHMRRKARPHADTVYAVQPGWFQNLDNLERAKKLSHDLLIEQMGDTRTGGVRWTWNTGPEALRILAHIRTGAPPVLDLHYAQIEARLRLIGGWLIVAMAEGTPVD